MPNDHMQDLPSGRSTAALKIEPANDGVAYALDRVGGFGRPRMLLHLRPASSSQLDSLLANDLAQRLTRCDIFRSSGMTAILSR
jgi:hypothetical protein